MNRVLFFTHEQRRLYFHEPAYLEVYKPILESGLVHESNIYVYQRDIRWLRVLLERTASQSEFAVAFEDILTDIVSHKLQEFQPTHIIYSVAWPEESVQAPIFDRLRTAHDFHLTSIIWDHDEGRDELQEFDRSIISVSDRTIVLDSASRVDRIRSKNPPYEKFSNTEQVVFCPTVPPPSIFFPRAGKKKGISLVGSSEGFRVKVEQYLRRSGLDFCRIGGIVGADKFLMDADYAREIAESKIVINTQTMSSRLQLKGRVAQVISCGTFLLEQDNIESRKYLSGMPVVFWSTEEDLLNKARYYLENDNERELIAANCRQKWSKRYSVHGFARVALGMDKC